MKRIVLTTFGSFGDLHPFLAVALELKNRGHAPIIATSQTYRAKVTELGLDFQTVRPDLPSPEDAPALIEKVMDAKRGTEFLFKEMLMPNLRDSYHDILQIAHDADCLVTHPITFGAHIVAQQLNIPWISAVLSPISLWSAFDPPVPPVAPRLTNLKVLGPRLNRALMTLPRAITASWTKPVTELRRELGLPRGAHPVFEGSFSPHLVLALFSSQLAEPQPDWPPNTVQTGFCFHDLRGSVFTSDPKTPPPAQRAPVPFVRGGETNSPPYEGGVRGGSQTAPKVLVDKNALSPELENFLQSGTAPIVFTLGSSAVMAPGEFFRESIAATQILQQRAVLLIGDEKWQEKLSLPENICAVPYAPHSQIFPRACAIVHQGGVGTTAQAMRAGIPQLVMPFSHDQFDNAQRIARRGAGRVLQRSKYFGSRVAHDLEALQSQSKYLQSAQEIATKMRTENGTSAACDAIENYLLHNAKAR